MKPGKSIPLISLGLMAVSVVYLWVISDQPRMADGALIGDEIRWYEMGLVLALLISLFATMFIAARHATRSGSWVWLLACLFFWPSAYLYTLVVTAGDEA